MERDRHRSLIAVVVDPLDEQLQQPPLLARTERLPNGSELGQRPRGVDLVDRIAAEKFRFIADLGLSPFTVRFVGRRGRRADCD
jgi:hypothetical protein